LTRDDPRFTSDQRIFLSETYNLKSIADYETGPAAEISAERAKRAIERATQFVSKIVAVLTADGTSCDDNGRKS